MTVGGSWFDLVFKAIFPHLGRAVASHNMQSLGEHSVGDGPEEPGWQFRVVWLGCIDLDHG